MILLKNSSKDKTEGFSNNILRDRKVQCIFFKCNINVIEQNWIRYFNYFSGFSILISFYIYETLN